MPHQRKKSGTFAGFQVVALLALASCTTQVASGLDEAEANRTIVALQDHGISAEKERDPEVEGHFLVRVGKDDGGPAAAVLTNEALPASASPGILKTLGQGSVVPSRLSEHARLLAGISGELETSLRAVDGVVSARVHLALPERGLLETEETELKPSASVLLRHRGATPPLPTTEIQRLVAGAVPGLQPQSVSVVASLAPSAVRAPSRELAQLGPVTVTRGSLSSVRALVAGAVLLNLALLGALLALWTRMRRTELLLGEARAQAETGRA